MSTTDVSLSETPPPGRWRSMRWVLAANAIALFASFLLVASSIGFFASGEAGEGFFLGWCMIGLPVGAVVAIVCTAIGSLLPRQKISTGALVVVLVLGAVLALIAAVLGAAWGAGFLASQSNLRMNAPVLAVSTRAFARSAPASPARYAHR